MDTDGPAVVGASEHRVHRMRCVRQGALFAHASANLPALAPPPVLDEARSALVCSVFGDARLALGAMEFA